MRIEPRFLNWGVFFVLLGAIPLAVQGNVIDRDVVARAWQLWPLLIIGAGAGLLLRQTAFNFVGGLIAAATFGVMFGGLLAVGTDFASFARSCGSDAASRTFGSQQGSLSGSAAVTLTFTCGDLTVGTTPGSSWSVSGAAGDGQAPRIDASTSRLDVRSRDSNGGIFGFDARQSWNVSLPQDPLLDVSVTINAGTGSLGFAGAHVGTLSFQGNAGSATIDLSAVASARRVSVQFNAGSAKVSLPSATLTGDFQVNAGSISFCVPEGVGLRLTADQNITASNNYADAGLAKNGNAWESANYASAANHIDLTTNANAGGFTLNPKEGCR